MASSFSSVGSAFRGPLLAAVLCLGFASGAAADTGAALTASDQKTIADAIYSKAQARTGRKLFRNHCKACHGREYFQPVFRAWSGQPLHDFFGVMTSTMPQTNPGALARSEYVDILAYILDQSGFPEGDEPLDYGSGEFEAILITAP